MAMTPNQVLATIDAWPFPLRLQRGAGGKWRLEFRVDRGGQDWRNPLPAASGFDDLPSLIEAADARVQQAQAASLEALNASLIDDFLAVGKLLRQEAPDPAGWVAQLSDGTWTDPQPTPRGAVRLARASG